MTADILTKALLGWKVITHAFGLGLCHASGGVSESGTPEVPEVEADRARGSAGGCIAHSTIAGRSIAFRGTHLKWVCSVLMANG